MNFKYFVLCTFICSFISCKEKLHLNKIEGTRLEINDQLPEDLKVKAFIEPFKNHVDKNLDSVLAFSVDTYSKNDGDLNTAIGNLMADAVLQEANTVFKSRANQNIDFVLLNHGGIRSILSKGNITSRTAYKIMPFENSVVVAALPGIVVQELVSYLIDAKRAHPISGLTIKLDKEYRLIQATINGELIDNTKVYFVATNDYLFDGGDNMSFFKKYDTLYRLDYKVRNVLIDYFSKKDTIRPNIDNRFIRIN